MIGSAELTTTLVGAPSTAVDERIWAGLRQNLSTRIAPLVEGRAPGDQVKLSLSLLRQARSRPESLADPPEPFAWKPVFVRRSLGLAVVRACATRRFRSPAEAVGPVADQAVADWEQTGWRTYHWEPWLAGLAPGARAAVLAEATTWATSLWSSLDWEAFGPVPEIGGPDDTWVCPASRSVRLKGRCEMRVPLGDRPGTVAGAPAGGSRGLVSVASGSPGATWGEELAYLALVAGLRTPIRPRPARVVGLWPEAGVYRIVETDEQVLAAAADRVVATVSVLAEKARARVSADEERPGPGPRRRSKGGQPRAVAGSTGSDPSEQGPGRLGVRLARRG